MLREVRAVVMGAGVWCTWEEAGGSPLGPREVSLSRSEGRVHGVLV